MPRGDLGAEISLEGRRRRSASVANTSPAKVSSAQLARRLPLGCRVLRHAALAADAAPERDTGEVASKVVGPVVIDAGEFLALPRGEAQQRAAVGAAVLERVQLAVGVARHHDRHVAEVGGAERVGARQLGLEAEKVPGVAAKDALLFLRVEIRVGIDPVRHAGQAFAGPLPYAGMHGHDLLQPKWYCRVGTRLGQSVGSILRRGRRLHTKHVPLKGSQIFAEWVAQSDWNTVYFKCPNSEVRIRALAGPAYLKDRSWRP